MLDIVIPTKNESENILKLLKSLEEQSFKDFFIILSDANSTDDTIELVKNHQFYEDNKIKIVDGGLPAIGRNNGAKYGLNEYVLFIDADVTFKDKFLLEKSLNLMNNKKLNLVTTNLACRNNKIVSFIYIINNFIQKLSKFDKPFSTGAYFFIRKSVFNELNGFDENDYYAEDYHLSQKINRHKFGIVNSYIYSDDRRFKKNGYFNIIYLFIKTFINRKNDDYYKEKINYF